MAAIERIWLDPGCQSDADYHIDRCWHSTRPDDCEECGMEPEEFISRATHDRLIAEAVADERERCAKIADDEFGGRCIADKIRGKWVP